MHDFLHALWIDKKHSHIYCFLISEINAGVCIYPGLLGVYFYLFGTFVPKLSCRSQNKSLRIKVVKVMKESRHWPVCVIKRAILLVGVRINEFLYELNINYRKLNESQTCFFKIQKSCLTKPLACGPLRRQKFLIGNRQFTSISGWI